MSGRRRSRGWIFYLLSSCCILAAAGFAQDQPQLRYDVSVRWWLVPVYAVARDGSPVLNLDPEDLEIYVEKTPIEQFTLHKKEFQPGPAPAKKGPPQKKLVFLVFDASFSPYNLLLKAKKIADEMIARSDKAAQYVVMSIEPLSGLRHICGPTRDLALIAKNIKKFVDGKKSDYILKTSDLDSSGIRDIYPEWFRRDRSMSVVSDRGQRLLQRIELRDKKRETSVFISSLMTLNVILGSFPDFSKVVFLYSCGVPASAFEVRTEFPRDPDQTEWVVALRPDTISLGKTKALGEYFNESGALLFLINPAGTRVAKADGDSGEDSLRLLAHESGGRYFEGAVKDIIGDVNGMEGGYYEISFPDRAQFLGKDMDFEIRSKKPGVDIYTVRKIGRDRAYKNMTGLEKEALVINVLDDGPCGRAGRKVIFVNPETERSGGFLSHLVTLPAELPASEWDVFQIWRNADGETIRMEKDRLQAGRPAVRIRMKWMGKDVRHDVVLIHRDSGTILAWK